MNKLRILTIGVLTASALISTSCKKYVTQHEQNYPHTELTVQEVTIYANQWSGGVDGYEGTISGGLLTPELLTDGVVMCYIKDGGSYVAMPITLSFGSYVTHWAFAQNSNSITILNYDDDGLTPPPGDQTFKIAIFTQAGLIAHPNVDINDFESVKKEFNF